MGSKPVAHPLMTVDLTTGLDEIDSDNWATGPGPAGQSMERAAGMLSSYPKNYL
jgi:hypothetical protein